MGRRTRTFPAFVAFLAFAVLAALALPACAPDGGGGAGDGTPTPSPSPTPGEPEALAGILARHNEVRAGVGVGPLVWSTALALTAQSWAESCVDADDSGLIDHNPDRSQGHPYYVGENIFGSTGTATGPEAVDLWASEVADYDYDTNTCTGVCGHYTQVVWAASQHLGCGVFACANIAYGYSIVCNYGPGGNTGGRPY